MTCLAGPCAKCPWRAEFKGDDDYLRPGRREGIVKDLLAGGSFPCHNTTDLSTDDGEGYTRTGDESECAGLDLVFLRGDNMPQMLRIRERIGLLDPEALLARNEDVALWTMRESLDETLDEEEGETCSVVGDYCVAPAGYMEGGEVVHGTTFIDTYCPQCGDPVCDECMEDVNHMCVEEEDAELLVTKVSSHS